MDCLTFSASLDMVTKMKTICTALLTRGLLSVCIIGTVSCASTFKDTDSADIAASRGRIARSSPEIAIQAVGLIGVPYKYGGEEPESGLDCSGLVRYLFREALGTELPRRAEQMSKLGQHVDANELRPGDLVFYNTLKRAFSHVGVYLGEDKFIHAPSSGGYVRIESMNVSYWKKRFNGARRLVE
jgi:cell wall-associated NlpC family hydrolase